MKASKIIAIIIAVAAFLWMASGFFFPSIDQSASSEGTVQKKLEQVRIRYIEATPYQDEITLTGRTQASRAVEIKAEISAEVIKTLKEEGQRAQKGEILAKLDVRDKKARQLEASGRLEQRHIEYNAAKKLENKGFNSKVRLAQALADLEGAKANLKQARIDLEQTNIQAPFDGIILEQSMENGDYVAIGSTMFSIVDLDPIEIVAFVSERKVQDLVFGQRTYVEFLDGRKIEGRVSYIAPAADDQTRTFRVIISAPNIDLMIKGGLTAKIRMPVKSRKAYRISPSILTLNAIGQIGIKIVNDQDIVEFIPIKILASKKTAMWISGPPNAARFITVGQEFVIEGQKVTPVTAPKGSKEDTSL